MNNTKFNFKKDLQQANKIENLIERLLFLKKLDKEFKQSGESNMVRIVGIDEVYYDDQMREEIKYVQELIKNQPQQNKSTPTKQIELIKWRGTPGQLIYLFEQLKEQGFFSLSMDLQAAIKKHFADENGKPFTNTKQAKQNYLNTKTGKPKKSKDIENLTDKLKEIK